MELWNHRCDLRQSDILLLAIEKKRFEIGLELIKGGCNLDARTRYGRTALMYTLQQNNHKFAKHLIDAGCDLNLQLQTAYPENALSIVLEKLARIQLNPDHRAVKPDNKVHDLKKMGRTLIDLGCEYIHNNDKHKKNSTKWFLHLKKSSSTMADLIVNCADSFVDDDDKFAMELLPFVYCENIAKEAIQKLLQKRKKRKIESEVGTFKRKKISPLW